ncbi:radical SAM protein [Clostridium perfringens]
MAHFRKRCLSVLITDVCNLHCSYCYCKGTKSSSNKVNMRFVKRAILDFYEQEGKIFVRFFGDGEPTLFKDTIKEIVEFCYNIDKNAKFELQTNGTYNEDFGKWIAENINIVWISYDGTTEINDHYRKDVRGKSVSKLVEKNIKYLATRIETLGVRSTIGAYNVYRQNEIIDKMEELGVKNIYSDLMFGEVGTGKYFEKEVDTMVYAKTFLEAYRYAKNKGISYGSFFTINFDEKVLISCRSCVPMPHLTTDGYVSCCDMGYEYDERMDCLFYGKYDSETDTIHYNTEKIKYLQERSVNNLKECENCEAKYHCAGGCIGEALNEKGSIYAIKEKNCEAIRYLAKAILEEGVEKMPLHP